MSSRKSRASRARTNPSRTAASQASPDRGVRTAPNRPDETAPLWRWWLLPLLLLVTAAAYQPAWHGGLLWDDAAHLTRVELGSVDGLRRIWFELGATQQYYPITHSAFWAMHRLWGDHTLGYHLINIVLHALSAFVLAMILFRLKVPGAILAAVIFAVHPVHVESVAWMTELKNTLSGALYLTAAFVYLEFDNRREAWRYLLALILFVLAVLSKTVAATLPAALLVVFWWRRGRLGWRRDIAPLLPFFAIGVASGLTTAWVERKFIGAEGASFQFTLIERCLIAGRAIWFYLGKLVWPTNLIFIYPRWEVSQGIWWQYLYPITALAFAGGLWWMRGRTRAPLAALLFFGGTLFPALGFFNVYPFEFSFVADHFQYLASLGIIVLAAAALATLADRWRMDSAMKAAAVLMVACPLAVLTWRQSRQYADVKTLYRATISRNPSCWLAENNLGDLLFHESPDNLNEAVAHFKRAISARADWAPSHYNLGMSWQKMGRLDEAVGEFKEAARLQPRFAGPRASLGDVFREMGRPAEAAASYEDVLRLKPTDNEARSNLAGVLLALDRPKDAVSQLLVAVKLEPGSDTLRGNLARAWVSLGNQMARLGRPADAVGPYQEALILAPDSAEAHNNLAGVLLGLGRAAEAVPHFREAVRLAPDSAAARGNLANAVAILERLQGGAPR